MGLGVSSEPIPLGQQQSTQSTTATTTNYSSVAFITSVSSSIQVSPPCQYLPPRIMSSQLQGNNASSSTARPASPVREGPLACRPVKSPVKAAPVFAVGKYENGSPMQLKVKNQSTGSEYKSSSEEVPVAEASALSLPSLLANESSSLHHADCEAENSYSHHKVTPFFSLSDRTHIASATENSEFEFNPDATNDNLYGMGKASQLNDQHNKGHCEYNNSLASSSTMSHQCHSLSNLKESGESESSHSSSNPTAGVTASSSSGCGHWCSTCRVKVKVEVECVPGPQRSPSGSRRCSGIRNLSLPKRIRHKVKVPTKDISGSNKKRKIPWSFRLNCRLGTNKMEAENELGMPSLNMGCVSCVCPGYQRPDTEVVYKSMIDSCRSTRNAVLHSPVVDLSRVPSDPFPVNDTEENTQEERSREVPLAEGLEPHHGLIPLLRDNSHALALPLPYNSMLDLQVLLESSLRLGLGNPRIGGIACPGEGFMRPVGPLSADASHHSRTVHTQVDYIHCLVPDLLAITNCGFYWGKMDRYEAERLLENRPEGTFLLRDSAQEEYLFSVSFRRYGRSLHARIEQWNHKFSFDSHDPGVYASGTVCGLIEHYKDPSCCMFFEPLLTNPLARTFPFPLQHLCRSIICSKTTYDGLKYLELPKTLNNYLKEYHYKQRVRVRHLD